ncbi:MAG: hypothetical protein ACPKNR_07735 [Pleomorphochaeta sp.]
MKKNKIWITIPSYWGDFGTKEDPPTIDFDHPTNPYGEETLSRTLNSIVKLTGDFNILIVLAVTHSKYLSLVKQRVMNIVDSIITNKKIYLITEDIIKKINREIGDECFSMDSYGNIRNIQLLIPYCFGAEYVLAVDDDEIIEDKNYVNKIVESLDSNNEACGIAGPYFDKNGEFEIKGADKLKDANNIFQSKIYYMNEALKKEMNHNEVFHPSIVAFGGNMSFKKKTINRVCHDPFIPRGEDYDYVLNALMFDCRYYFKKDAAIIHLPPTSIASNDNKNLRKLRADIVRFIYMNIKIDTFKELYPNKEFDLQLLNPYPGSLIAPISFLEDQARNLLLGFEENYNKDEIESFLKNTILICKKKSNDYFKYREKWENMLSDENLVKIVEEIVGEN